MNSTSKDRVKLAHPDACIVGVGGVGGIWTVYARPGGPDVLGRGRSPARAWKRAAERLGGHRGRPPESQPRALSWRGY